MNNKKTTERVEDAPYSLPWLRKYRASIVAQMESLVVKKKSSRTIKRKLKKLEGLKGEISDLWDSIVKECSHPLESQRYSESGREDTLGGYRRGMDLRIYCSDCKATLATGESN